MTDTSIPTSNDDNIRESEQLSLYVGSPIEHESERAVLQRIVELLTRDRHPAVILSNANFGNRQIDLVVCLNDLVLVIEAKGYARPIRGSENGTWQVQLASGDWKDFPSPYLQALNASHKVRDKMHLFKRRKIPYPKAAVVFVPAIPRGSNAHRGDFKVSVLGLDQLGSLLQERQTDALPLSDWKAFAEHLRLTQVSSVDAACGPTLFADEDLIRKYQTAFCRDNAGPESFVPFTCRYDDRTISTEEVTRMIREERAGFLIRGPSGCGKTLLGMRAGLASSESGAVVIAIPARDYAGSVKDVMDREVGLLILAKALKVLNAARRLNRPVLFLVDGYNECDTSQRAALTRGLVALSQRYQAGVLVTSQIPLDGGDKLAFRKIEVPPTDVETKAAIVRNVLGGDAPLGSLEDLLEAVTTGLEAKLIGEVGRELNPGSSRYALFDAFARKRLGDGESEGIRLLSLIAGRLCHRLAFGMSRRDLDRLTDECAVPEAVAARVRQAGLLIQRADRVHFAHELFFDAFAAEAVIRAASGNPTLVTGALAHPQHAGRSAFILGAIDDHQLLDQVLERLEDSVSVLSCLSGACGRKAQEWAEARAEKMWERLRSEALTASFVGSGDDWINYGFEKSKLTQWTRFERAFLDAIGQRIIDGYYLDYLLDTVGILDRRIAREEALMRKNNGENNSINRDAIFSHSYALQGESILGISHICTRFHGRFFRTIPDKSKETLEWRVIEGSLSTGQLYVLLALTRGSRVAARVIARAIESHWAEAPYHLKLDLMDAAWMGRQFGDPDRDALIETIEGLPQTRNLFVSSAIVEALSNLGALEATESEHITVVRKEIRLCLAHYADDEHCTSAYGIYAAQVDHPCSRAYCTAIAELRDDERKTLLIMALSGAHDTAFCVDMLLIDLASLGDSKAGGSISRWTLLPPTDSVMPQQSVAVFVIAHIALARLGCPLPSGRVAHNMAAKALVACGEILYWCNRHDLGDIVRHRGYEPRVYELVEHVADAAIDVIRHCEGSLTYDMAGMPGAPPVTRSIVDTFPDEVAGICRRSLVRPANQVGYFQYYSKHDRTANLHFAIGVIARHGNSTDLPELRRYANDKALGMAAISAIKAIEERLVS